MAALNNDSTKDREILCFLDQLSNTLHLIRENQEISNDFVSSSWNVFLCGCQSNNKVIIYQINRTNENATAS